MKVPAGSAPSGIFSSVFELVSLEGKKKRSLSDVVLEYEKNYESDIIMIMTKKEESLSDSLSVTARSIIFNSEIPVMCIHPKKRKHLGSTIGF